MPKAPLVYPASAITALLLMAFGEPFTSTAIVASLCALLLGVGLPHGTLDINLLVRGNAQSGRLAAVLVAAYLICAAAMFALWVASPVAALGLFLLMSVVHFAQDWAEDGNNFFAFGSALALISVPALFHLAAIRALFVALTNAPLAVYVADALMLLAPVALCAAGIGVGLNIHGRFFEAALSGATALISALVLPPLVAFALYFCIFHSPRHLAEGLSTFKVEAPRLVRIAVLPLSLASFGIAVFVFFELPRATLAAHAMSTAFVTLSILTVPHMLVPNVFARLARQALCAAAD